MERGSQPKTFVGLQAQLQQAEKNFDDLKTAFLTMEQIVKRLKQENVTLARAMKELTMAGEANTISKRSHDLEIASMREQCERAERELAAVYESETFRYITKPTWKLLGVVKALRRKHNQ